MFLYEVLRQSNLSLGSEATVAKEPLYSIMRQLNFTYTKRKHITATNQHAKRLFETVKRSCGEL